MRMTPPQPFRLLRAAVRQDVPVYAHWGITHRCGLTCKMCGIWRYGNRKEELELDDVTVMAKRMRRLGVAQLAIGGGEPFEREDLDHIAKIFIDEGVNLRVLTNGVTTPPELLRRVIDAGCKNFSVSLDTLYPERYDYICEVPDSWTRGVKTMLDIARLTLPKGGLPTINCVVSNLNLDELPEMVKFAKAIGFHISFLPIELLTDPKEGVRNWEARFIRHRPEMGIGQNQSPTQVRERIETAYNTIIGMKNDGWPILNTTPYLEASRQYLLTGRFPTQGCHAGRMYFSVAPNGQFTICHRKAQEHVSFLDPDFEDYFHSEAYERQRHFDASTCEGCMRACWIDTSYMFTTMQGFFETARLVTRGGRTELPSYDEALAWARHDDTPIVPVAAAK